MTMVICKECKAQISTLAVACLHCGASKRKTSNLTSVAIAFLGITLLANTWLLWRLYDIESRMLQDGIARGVHGTQ